jgi:diguanylate cyclase (GGDEF)-like protein/PAS domain S-box-containing protein
MPPKTYTPPASFIDLLIDAVFAVDADANVVFASAACERIFGYTPREMIGRNMFDMMVPEVRERTRESVKKIMAGNPQLSFENSYIRKDGQIVHIMWSARWSPADQLRIAVAHDITERKRTESMQEILYAISEAAHATEDLLALFERIHRTVGTLLQVDNFSVILHDEETGQLSFPYHVDKHEPTPTPASQALYTEIIHTGQPLLLTCEAMADRLSQPRGSDDASPFCWLGVPLKSRAGTIGVLAVKSYPGGACYNPKDQELLQFVSTQIATAIERRQMQARLRHMAQYDQLTALPNRALLYDRLKVGLSAARRDQERLAVLYIDLDKFKRVNDTLGHSAGDQLLRAVAKRLGQCMRASDTVARIGGDEFVVLLPRIALPEHAQQVARKIYDVLSHPFAIAGSSLNIRPSIGVALYPEHGDGEQLLLNYADKAMYCAKSGADSTSRRQ